MMSTRPGSYGVLGDGDDVRRGKMGESVVHTGSYRRAPRSHKDVECLKRVLSTQECAEQSGTQDGPNGQGCIERP